MDFNELANVVTRRFTVRANRHLVALLLSLFLPTFALAGEGDHIRLQVTSELMPYLYGTIGLGVVALIFAFVLIQSVMKESPGTDSMQKVGKAIKEGALAYLAKQIQTMSAFALLLVIGLYFLYQRDGASIAVGVAASFVAGLLGSYAAGYTGMVTAVNGNMRVAFAALNSYKSSLEIAFKSGSVAGLVTVGIGLIGASVILAVGGADAVKYLVGFGFGGSLAALFMRVGGGIFTKAADVGADLVGKVEAGIPEDDPRNPAVIADNVGDNVGDCAGMAADVFESYAVTLVSAIVLAAATANVFDAEVWMKLVVFSLVAAGIGIISSIIGILAVRGSEDRNLDPLKPIRKGFITSVVVSLAGTAGLAFVLLGGSKPLSTSRLVSVKQYELNEAAALQKLRNELATQTWDKEALRKAADAKAKEVKRAFKDLTVFDIYGDRQKIPKEFKGIPQAVTARVIADKDVPIRPNEITAFDVIQSKAGQARGLKDSDEMSVSTALNVNLAQAPEPPKFEGFTRVTNADDPNIPALKFAVQKAFDPQNPGSAGFRTVAEAFLGKGDDEMVLKQIRVKADLPAQPGQNGMPAAPAQKIDQTSWIGPINKGEIEKQLADQRKQIADQKINATIEDLKTLPVALYVNGSGKLILGVSNAVDKPQQLRTQTSSYFPVDVKTMESVNSETMAGMPMATPPMESIELAVVEGFQVPWYLFLGAFAVGLILSLVIEKVTEYYVGTGKKPTQEVSGMSTAGAASMLIKGFAYAAESGAAMTLTIVIALLSPMFIFPVTTYGGYELAMFGIALVGLGLLSTTGYVLAMDTFGPISDNAQGVFEMSGEGTGNEAASQVVSRLDAAGNTTKALTKGFAIATAVVAAIALFNSYRASANLTAVGLKLDVPEIFLGLLIGGAAPFLFSAFAINAVGRSSFELIREVRRQFREKPGIMNRTEEPDYAKCVAMVTSAAQRELLGPGILAIALPIAVGFGFGIGKPTVEVGGQTLNLTGAQALGGFLAGAIVSGQLLAVLLSNAGGMWDNAKKIVEDGNYGGKNSEAHKAAVTCDTVGDPFKDTAGPALNPLIKVMNLVALLMGGVVTLPMQMGVRIAVTAVCVIALAYAIWSSKRGSLVDDLNQS
jgi:K(+)-stimulated pyrophosphate-energized sodium pump